jgi:aminoglycoside phosphotransferase family enzyme/predicted kinase
VNSPIEARETHISLLFFTPDRVFKLLKPVRTSFLDHSTAERRREAVAAELELNRRFSPDVYLGIAEMREHGVMSDAALIMRRLPDQRRLSGLLDETDADDHLRRVAHSVATVHAGAAPIHEPSAMTTAPGLLSLWESSFADIAAHVGPVISAREYDRISQLARNYLSHAEWLFDERTRQGFVRDGHGDLTADDIFMLDDGPRILDCLAFDPGLRVSDVLADIAFLVMDVERLTGAERARRLLRYYCELTGEHHPASLAHHYVGYRAHVRAKVELLRYAQGHAPSAAAAARYHRQTLDHLSRARQRVVLIGGGPGTGKTTVARALAAAYNWAVVDSDTLRKDLRRVDHDDHEVGKHPDLYDRATTEATYAELCREAGALLRAGESVIVDATWADDTHRAIAAEVAGEHGAELVAFECRLAPELASARIRERQAAGGDASDATPDVVARLAGQRHPWPGAHVLDTEWPLESVVAEAAAVLDSEAD